MFATATICDKDVPNSPNVFDDAMEGFTHSPLNLDRPAIRLLQLRQGTVANIECDLFQAYLDDNHDDLIPYEALSYTWGGTKMYASVKINSKYHEVTENLYLALQHLRLPDRDRILWVDALCIDQGSERERGHQVRQMGTIYARAHSVLIWLGLGSNERTLLVKNLAQLHEFGRRSWSLDNPRWSDVWSTLQSQWYLIHSRLRERQTEGLRSMLSQPWFTRVWILQEVANARRATIHVGVDSMPAQMLALAPRLILYNPKPHCQAVLDIMPGQPRESSWWSKDRDLYTLLRKFGGSEATDPRDKIYALLGICSDGGSLNADYTKDLSQAVHETAIHLFDLPARTHRYKMSDGIPCVIRQSTQTLNRVVQSHNLNWIDAFVRSRSGHLDFGQKEFEAAAKNTTWGLKIVRYMMGHPRIRVQMNQSLLYAALNSDLNNTYSLRNLRSVFSIEDILMCAAGFHAKFMALILDDLGIDAKITTPVLVTAASNLQAGAELVALLMQYWNPDSEIASSVIEAATRNRVWGLDILTHLLNGPNTTCKITTKELVAASYHQAGAAMVNLLLKHGNGDFEVTAVVIEAAITKSACSLEVLNVCLTYLEHHDEKVVIGRRVVEDMALHHHRDDILTRLLTLISSSAVMITDEALETLAYSREPSLAGSNGRMMTSWSQKRINSDAVTNEEPTTIPQHLWMLALARWVGGDPSDTVLRALAANEEYGPKVLIMFLKSRGHDTMITGRILVFAITTNPQRTGLIQTVLEYYIDQPTCVHNTAKDMQILERREQNRNPHALITGRVIESVVTMPGDTCGLLTWFSTRLGAWGATKGAFHTAKQVVRSLSRALWRLLNLVPVQGASHGFHRVTNARFKDAGKPPPPEWTQEARWEHVPWIDEDWYSRFDLEWDPCLSQLSTPGRPCDISLFDSPFIRVGRYSDPDRDNDLVRSRRRLDISMQSQWLWSPEQILRWDSQDKSHIEDLYRTWMTFTVQLHRVVQSQDEASSLRH